MNGKASIVVICFLPYVYNNQGREDKANIAGLFNIWSLMHLTGLSPKYFGLESVNFPVIVSIEVLTIIPFLRPVYKYSCVPYFDVSS